MFMTPIERTRVTESLTSAIVWSLKEASWKALQLGPGVSFHDLELDIDEGRGLRAVLLRGVWLPASATIALPWPGFVLTIVRVERRP
jgi:phosphopantetheinyl transferase (holo-ACP synthase)